MGAQVPLFNIAVAHRYFSQGVCPCLDFVPTLQTRRLMQNSGVLVHRRADGIGLSYDQDREEVLRLYDEDSEQPLCFAFKVYAEDPDFRSYTEPFRAAIDTLLYFDNGGDSPAQENTIRLHGDEYVSKIDLVALDAPQLMDVLSQQERLLPPICVVKIFAREGRRSRLDAWLRPEPFTYHLSFQARRTVWKYYLLGEAAAQEAFIVDTDGHIQFEALGRIALSDARRSLAYQTTQSIPLSQHYDFRFQLKTQSQEGEKVLIKRLPLACVSRSGKEEVAGQGQVVSEIYVNS